MCGFILDSESHGNSYGEKTLKEYQSQPHFSLLLFFLRENIAGSTFQQDSMYDV